MNRWHRAATNKSARKAARAAAEAAKRNPARVHAATARSVAIQRRALELCTREGRSESWAWCVEQARNENPPEYTP